MLEAATISEQAEESVRQLIGLNGHPLDKELATLISELWLEGFETIGCCIGHPSADSQRERRCPYVAFRAERTEMPAAVGRLRLLLSEHRLNRQNERLDLFVEVVEDDRFAIRARNRLAMLEAPALTEEMLTGPQRELLAFGQFLRRRRCEDRQG